MAFQTNVLRDGAWVTTTVDLNTVLKGSTVATTPAPPPLPTPPDCAILTRTVIESPIARWVLPALLRSAHHNDVAFVGDRYVKICELRKDGQLQEVLRKNDFGCRIRNACVIGNKYERFRATADDAGVDHIKSEDEDEDTQMADFTSASGPTGSHGLLPPHLLLLVLETGTFVFLFIKRDVHGKLEFVASPFHNPAKRMGHHLGFHVAVDPRSRYVAVADAQNRFVVYELESMEVMSEQYMRQKSISPVKTHHHRAVQGTILKLEFLYPRPEDQHHVILLIILAKRDKKGDKSKMVVYEWERGNNLGEVFAEEKRGYSIRPEHRIPLLVIPLTVRSSFLVVSENAFGICKDPLQGPLDIEDHCPFDPKDHPTTRFHHGIGPPLWTAWDRPVRRRGYYDTNDHIYLAREDGVVVFFEFNSKDVLGVSMNVGECDCNISSAFTTMYDAYSDFAIVAGESGPGLVFQLKPRQSIVQLGPIPNWACAVDFTTTDQFSSWNPTNGHKGKPIVPWRQRTADHISTPDKVLCASGNEPEGSITELRHGLPANIISYFETLPTKRAWVFRTSHANWPYQMLLTSPGTSDVLLVSGDLSQAEMAETTATQLDTMSRTLAAEQSRDGTITQVSEQFLTIARSDQSVTSFAFADFRGIKGAIEHAAIRGNYVCVSGFSESGFQLYVFRVDNSELSAPDTLKVDGEVTCLSFCCIGGSECILVGLWRENSSHLALYPVDGPETAPILIRLDTEEEGSVANQGDAMDVAPTVELITSIVVVTETTEKTSVVLGSRSGHLITLQLNGTGPYNRIMRRERVGTVAAHVFPVDSPYLPGAIMVCCNDALLLLRDFEAKRPGRFATIHRVWITDLKDPATASAPVISATSMPIDRSVDNHMPLVLLSGNHISFTELYLHDGPVPRRLPLQTGTPLKILYSKTLQCLVIALQVGDQPNIMFMDQETGENLSYPLDRNSGNPTTFINGMGGHGDRILGIFEWLYTQASMTFHYLIITTRGGRLVLVSATKEDYRDSEDNRRRRIRFVTRYKTKEAAPICSVVGDDQGLVYCAGNTLCWDVLDTTEKKLVRKKTYELNSPALSLRIVNDKVCALTLSDSLVIIDHKSDHKSDEMELIHMDETTRKSNHFFDIGDSVDGSSAWPVTLLCGMNRDFAAVWTPWQQRDAELVLVAEGSLPASVRKLGRGHVRPDWLATEHAPRYGSIPSTVDGAEIVGMSLDGSVIHFNLLNMHAWRFLRFVQNLAMRSRLLFPYIYDVSLLDDEEYDAEVRDSPKSMMHIDGDLLQRCVEKEALQTIISGDSNIDLLREYLDYLDDGEWTASFQDVADVSKYFDLAYDVLDYYLTPVL